jgi:hypothetical protein
MVLRRSCRGRERPGRRAAALAVLGIGEVVALMAELLQVAGRWARADDCSTRGHPRLTLPDGWSSQHRRHRGAIIACEHEAMEHPLRDDLATFMNLRRRLRGESARARRPVRDTLARRWPRRPVVFASGAPDRRRALCAHRRPQPGIPATVDRVPRSSTATIRNIL